MIKRSFIPVLVCLAVVCAQSAAAHSSHSHWRKDKHHDKHHSDKDKCCKNGSSGDAPTLQEILDALVVSGPAIDANSPSGIELWDNAIGPMTAQVVADYTGKKQLLWFGMYPDGDPDNRAFLLSDHSKVTDVTSVTFLEDGDLSIRGRTRHNGHASGFDGPFGFFVKTLTKNGNGNGNSRDIWFTDADLNGGDVRAKVFAGDGLTTLKLPCFSPGLFLPNQFLIAFETGDDDGFDDFLVLVTGIVPLSQVPEPALGWLIGLSLAALRAQRVRRI